MALINLRVMRRKNRRRRRAKVRLTDNGLMVVLSILLAPAYVLIVTDSCLLIACALLWIFVAVALAHIWSPSWANDLGEKMSKWLDD